MNAAKAISELGYQYTKTLPCNRRFNRGRKQTGCSRFNQQPALNKVEWELYITILMTREE